MTRPILLLPVLLTACIDVVVEGQDPTDDTGTLFEPPPTGDTGELPPPTDVELLDDEDISRLAEAGQIRVDLGDGRDDPTVLDDARTLLLGAIDGVVVLEDRREHVIVIEYRAKGDLGELDPEQHDRTRIEDAIASTGWIAFNPATRNEFRLDFEGGLLDSVGIYDRANRLDLGTAIGTHDEDKDLRAAVSTPWTPGVFSWSNGDDDRNRMYGVDAEVTLPAHRRIVQLGGGCSGTLVGPRHVVTAGHCLWSRRNDRWSNRFNVRAGANGTNEVAEVFVDSDAIPAGQALWYYTPAQFRGNGSTWGYDYGILVLPGRLGDEVGWMGRVTYGADSLDDANVFHRGYPVCNASLSDGTPRIDDPSPCQPNHLYGNAATCDVGEFQSQDGSGWSRIVHHSCDASAGDSGSPLYVYHGGTPAVAAVHFFSHCEKTVDDLACTGDWEDRPLAALRLTPAYRDLIGTFRMIFP